MVLSSAEPEPGLSPATGVLVEVGVLPGRRLVTDWRSATARRESHFEWGWTPPPAHPRRDSRMPNETRLSMTSKGKTTLSPRLRLRPAGASPDKNRWYAASI